MAGEENEYDVEGNGHMNQPVTRFHFNGLRDHLRREFRNSLDPIEEKQDKLSRDLQQLMGNVDEQLNGKFFGARRRGDPSEHGSHEDWYCC